MSLRSTARYLVTLLMLGTVAVGVGGCLVAPIPVPFPDGDGHRHGGHYHRSGDYGYHGRHR